VVSGATLNLRGVSFGYRDRPVLDGLTLDIGSGEMVGLLGPNGAGKSTLLNLISGVLRPQAGTIRLNDVDLCELPPRTRAQSIAMVAQGLAAPFAFTIREWVSLGRTPYVSAFRGDSEADREAVRKALQDAGVDKLADRLVGEVSGGERQRAALALALAQEPSLLLLDEATAHLDVRYQMALLELVRRLNRDEGLTVIAAMHDVNLASLWFDRLLVLHDRQVVADGPPREVAQAELWERVFGCRVRVLDHPSEDVPLVALERDLTPLREPPGLLLREYRLPVPSHLEDAASARHQLQRADSRLVEAQYLVRQTDGFRQVVSSGAVHDPDLHRIPPMCPDVSICVQIRRFSRWLCHGQTNERRPRVSRRMASAQILGGSGTSVNAKRRCYFSPRAFV
jgi:ABC-type cobalamin/Fe3+-siderophores transport system ATPase subunit